MGRRKKQLDIEDAIEDTAKPGHNQPELTDDEKRALFFQHKGHYERALDVKKKADADFKNACKRAKADCGKSAVAEIKDALEFEGEDGRAKFNAELERKHRIARWIGLPVGATPSFFDMNDRTPSVEIAFDEGKQAGMRGDTARPPHDPSVPQHQKWMEGWHAGQEALASAFQKTKAPDIAVDPAAIDTSSAPFHAAEAGAAH